MPRIIFGNDRPFALSHMLLFGLLIAFTIISTWALNNTETAPPTHGSPPWTEFLTPAHLIASLVLLIASAFFSASEVAYFSLHEIHFVRMQESPNPFDRIAAILMEHPGRLLTGILMANAIVNVLLSIVFAAPIVDIFEKTLRWHHWQAFPVAVGGTTLLLVLFGEVFPKIVAMPFSRSFARLAAVPLYVVTKLLSPFQDLAVSITQLTFNITGLSQIRPIPEITEEEFLALLKESEAEGLLEANEHEMIQGILGITDTTVDEIKVPRPDIVALPENADVGQALALFQEHQFTRVPVYRDDLDHIVGLLHAKDLLPHVETKNFDMPIRNLLRPVHFVPRTLTVADFIRFAQQRRIHLAIVVDENRGTEGLITLRDALYQVVGDVEGDVQEEAPTCTQIANRIYEVEGSFPLRRLEETIGVSLQDDEHNTLGGFLMGHAERILSVGDEVVVDGVRYRVEEMDGKRVARVRVELPQVHTESEA